MKNKLIVVLLMLLIAAVAAIWFLKYSGVTHEDIYSAVTDESAALHTDETGND